MKRFLKIFSICFVFLAIAGLTVGYFYQSIQIKSLQQEIENQNQIIDDLKKDNSQITATQSSWKKIEQQRIEQNEINEVKEWINRKRQREEIMERLGVDTWDEALAMMEEDEK